MIHARRLAAGTAIAALIALSTPASAQRSGPPPQRGGQPVAETPYILVTAFHAPTKERAVEAADELRSRLASEHSARELFVITKATLEATLKASGYPVDSALGVPDLMELARALRAEYTIDGTVHNTGPGDAVRFDLRMLIKTGQQTLAQPLIGVNGKDVGDAAKLTEREISSALTQMPFYRDCIAALRTGKYDDAAAKARLGIAAYATSAYNRICLLNAYTSAKNTPPDSIIVLANQILGVDSTSMLALANLADAYKSKGDAEHEIATYMKIYALDPSNQTVVRSLIDEFMKTAPDKALIMIGGLLKDVPGDTALLKRKWVAHRTLKQYKQAMAAGDEYVKADPSAVTIDYFQSQIGAAQSDSDAAKAEEYATAGAQHFPKEASFSLLLAQTYYRAGQLPQSLDAARRVTAADPKSLSAWKFVLVVLTDMKQPDSAMAAGRLAIAAGVPKDSVGDVLLARVVGPTLRAAQTGHARTDWEAALKVSQAVDSIASSAQSNFYIGVSSFQVASDILTSDVQTLAKSHAPADHAQACTLSKQAEDYLATTQIAMPKGGSVDGQVASQILQAVPQFSEFIGSVKHAFCR
ncbi:MAG: tetratricopeptide repeat protein [Gemmatimonadaceae bacterium]